MTKTQWYIGAPNGLVLCVDEILEAAAESVQAERILRPVYNYKG